MGIETAVHIVDYILAVEQTESHLRDIGWEVQIPPHNSYTYSLHEVVMDLLDIPPEESGFIRDIYFDCFYDADNSSDIIKSLLEVFEENKKEYIEAGLVCKNK